MTDRRSVIDSGTINLPDKCPFPRFPNTLSHRVHRLVERHFSPFLLARRAILHFRFASRMGKQLVRGRAFRAKIPLANRTFRIALDRNQLSVLMVDQLSATNSAVRTNRARHAGIIGPGVHRARLLRHRFKASAILAFTELSQQRPFRKPIKHRHHLNKFRFRRQFWFSKNSRDSSETGTISLPDRVVPSGFFIVFTTRLDRHFRHAKPARFAERQRPAQDDHRRPETRARTVTWPQEFWIAGRSLLFSKTSQLPIRWRNSSIAPR